MAEGWVSLHRKLLENPVVCKDSDYLAVWIYILLNVTHKERDAIFKGQRITLKPGQQLFGRKVISSFLSISESKVQRILKTFENEQQIEQQTSNQNRLISIVNWSNYQQIEQQIEQPVNNERTTSEQPVNTNNNINNINNENNEINNMCDTPAEKPNGGAQVNKPGKGYTVEFENFWSVYPRRKEKIKAFRAWNARIKEKVNAEDLIKAATNYGLYCKANGTEDRFIKLASTFLGPDKPYEEYMVYEPSKAKAVANKNNTFANYGGQREYDTEELEKELLAREDFNIEEELKNADEITRQRLLKVLGRTE